MNSISISISGKVYIGSMNMRGKWAPLPNDSKRIRKIILLSNFIKLNESI